MTAATSGKKDASSSPPSRRDGRRGQRDRQCGRRRSGDQQRDRWSHGERRDERGRPEADGHQEDGRADRRSKRGPGQVIECRGHAGGGRLDVEAEHERTHENAGQPGGQSPGAQALDQPFDRLDEQPQAAAERTDTHHQAHSCVRSKTADE
ncbi:MAG TPA: hypothetical protein VK631_16280 [Solirubrobacteraceae bacterium]|nr:hypothetical protein [Solirubrobacteraceae bacterium]